ncbi:MAG: response regulator [Desulfobacteraceae bacterium]|nr:response regulator [Desulfobacteraceae bacterium]
MSYNVLIVDDSKSMRKVIRKTLQMSGFKVGEFLEASNGQEALDLLDGRWVDLILSDIHMPVMDGFTFIQSLRDKDLCKDTPIVFVTTEASEIRLKQLLALGASGYIRKPFRPEEIGTMLSRVMGETDEFAVGTSTEGCDF